MARNQSLAPAIDLNGSRVLVIEDDYFIADEICSTLRRCDAEVVGPAPDLDRGIQLLRQSQVDCVVLDVNLHGEISFDLAVELKRRDVPLIFASGYDASMLPGSLVPCVWLEKPIDLAALLQAVKAATHRPAPSVAH
jgi:DNA-binding response OmpR family regulator